MSSKDTFEKIDLVYPKKLAEIAENFPDFNQFLIGRGAGANPRSPSFYNKVEGKAEKELQEVELSALKIFRPTLLLGRREERQFGEELGKVISKLFSFFIVGVKKGLFSIHAQEITRAIFLLTTTRWPGYEVLSANKMIKLANLSEI